MGGPAELNRALLARPDQFVQALTEKLMTFALGRAVRYQDMPTVRAIVRDAAADNYRFETILERDRVEPGIPDETGSDRGAGAEAGVAGGT